MALSSYPFDGQDVTETQYSNLFAEFQNSGVAASADSNDFAVSADSSGMHVFVQPGFAIVRGFAVLSTAVEQLPIAPAATQTRIDRIILRLDPAANSIVLTIKEGTPGATAPDLEQTESGIYEVSLGLVTVGPTAVTIAAEDVAEDREFLDNRIGVWTTAKRPSAARVGKLGLNTTTERWEWWDGDSWADIAPVVTWTNIDGKPATFAPTEHTHPWHEVTDKPATYPPSSHRHPWDQLDNIPGTFPPSGHTHHANDVGSNNGWSLQTWINHLEGTKAEANHGHAAPTTVHRANGSDRVRQHTPGGSATWYSAWVDGYNNFCHNTSSVRFKTNIRDANLDPDEVLALQPRVYDRRGDDTPNDELGLIAEEVYDHVPEIVQFNDDGEIEALRYDLVGVILLPVVQRQAEQIAELTRRLDELA